MKSTTPERLEITRDPEDGEPGEVIWIQFRSKKQRFTGGERKAIYKYIDGVREEGAGPLYMQYELLRQIAAHLIHSWSVELPCPKVVIERGRVTSYEHLESLDELDDDIEKWILAYVEPWAKQLALNFGPNPDPDSPTSPSDDSKPVSEAPAA